MATVADPTATRNNAANDPADEQRRAGGPPRWRPAFAGARAIEHAAKPPPAPTISARWRAGERRSAAGEPGHRAAAACAEDE
jgi:hypothetical protein